MKNRLFVSSFSLLFLTFLLHTNVTMCANENDYEELTIHSLVLKNSWLYFKSQNGDVLLKERISDIRTIVFKDNHSGTPTDIVEIPTEGIQVYPNPAKEVIYLKGESVYPYRIYDLDGRCLLSGEGKEINVSPLKVGTYLLQINNITFKFIKQ